MELQVNYNDERQKLWIERLRKIITATQAELDKELPSFIALEEDYLKWKSKIDTWKRTIFADKQELEMFEHAEKFPANKVIKPRLIGSYPGAEKVQQQVVTKKFKQEFIPLKHIKWISILPTALKEIGRFVSNSELYEYLLSKGSIDNSAKTRVRMISAVGDSTHYTHLWKRHNNKTGLIEWFDGPDGDAPKQQYLKDFIGREAV